MSQSFGARSCRSRRANAAGLRSPKQANGIDYRLEPPERSLTARAGAERVRQIVPTLLGNATKFTAAGGQVTVTFGELAPAVVGERGVRLLAVRVTDSGVGMTSDQSDSVFEPFVQLRRGLASPSPGVGVGLAISHAFVRGMDGDLTAESTVGVGKTFTLTVPAA